MKFFIPVAAVFLITVESHEPGASLKEFSSLRDGFGFLAGRDETDLNPIEIIEEFGYPAEAHKVQTQDGYVLEMHRIPHSKHLIPKENSKRPPVFLQHGLLGSSADFFLLLSSDALPFILSDVGFDVWLGNVRSNTFSRNHVSLNPSDRAFWNFTWHESAIYDLPIQIDYIISQTGYSKIYYIGYSMGTTMFFVLMSTIPEYNDKIELGVMMAPVAYLQHIKSPLLLLLSRFSESATAMFDLLENGEFLPDNKLVHYLTAFICSLPFINVAICENVIFLIYGRHEEEFDPASMRVLLKHFPAGYSVKAVNHYAQLIKARGFQEYDYGENGNLAKYGTLRPPKYNISAVTVPMYFYVGLNDYLSVTDDIYILAAYLKSLRDIRVIAHPKFSHLDFVLSKHVKKLLYDLIIRDIRAHLPEEQSVEY